MCMANRCIVMRFCISRFLWETDENQSNWSVLNKKASIDLILFCLIFFCALHNPSCLFQVLINGVWILVSPPRAVHHYPTREDNHLVCSSHIDASYMIAFGYPIVLIIVCTIYAVLTRKIPEAFNESKHIGMFCLAVFTLKFLFRWWNPWHSFFMVTCLSLQLHLNSSKYLLMKYTQKIS